jgi:hypothetical protein
MVIEQREILFPFFIQKKINQDSLITEHGDMSPSLMAPNIHLQKKEAVLMA